MIPFVPIFSPFEILIFIIRPFIIQSSVEAVRLISPRFFSSRSDPFDTKSHLILIMSFTCTRYKINGSIRGRLNRHFAGNWNFTNADWSRMNAWFFTCVMPDPKIKYLELEWFSLLGRASMIDKSLLITWSRQEKFSKTIEAKVNRCWSACENKNLSIGSSSKKPSYFHHRQAPLLGELPQTDKSRQPGNSSSSASEFIFAKMRSLPPPEENPRWPDDLSVSTTTTLY